MSGIQNTLLSVLDEIAGKRVLVVGDIMLDKYIWGDVSRISPEAPVQVVHVQKETFAPGGAANVANNLSVLGCRVMMVGLVGSDDAQKTLFDEFFKRRISTDGIVVHESNPTIQKVRVVGKNQQLLRFDYERSEYIADDIQEKVKTFISGCIDDLDAIALSDYAKGVVTKDFAQWLISLAREKDVPLIVDPKPKHKAFYSHATIITPNHLEAHKLSGVEETNDDAEIERMGLQLCRELKSSVLLTRGEKGMSLFEVDKDVVHIPTYAQEVYDIAGAGDTVVATLTAALACGSGLEVGAHLANHAAGIVVRKVGTATVRVDEIRKGILSNSS